MAKNSYQVAPVSNDPSIDLRKLAAAVRVQFTWLGVRKTLSADQKALAADPFGAEGGFLSASKKLLDTKHEAFKTVSSIKSRASAYWKSTTLPYPEPGVRLIRQSALAMFNSTMQEFRTELTEAVAELSKHYKGMIESARNKLGSLFNEQDYPADISNMFAIDWDFPSVEPPGYLKDLSPELYKQEQDRVAARFTEAVALAEMAFAEEFKKLVSGLVERLQGKDDGEKKVFRDSSIVNLTDFFDRFKVMSLRSNVELDKLVEQAKGMVKGVISDDLRTDPKLRETFAKSLAEVNGTLEKLMINAPRRKVIRGVKKEK